MMVQFVNGAQMTDDEFMEGWVGDLCTQHPSTVVGDDVDRQMPRLPPNLGRKVPVVESSTVRRVRCERVTPLQGSPRARRDASTV